MDTISHNEQHTMPVHKKRNSLYLSRHSVPRANILKILAALLLTILLFLCTALLSHTTKTFAVRAVITLTPIGTIVKATATPRPSRTPKPSPTVAPTPTPKATPIPTATTVPTVVPSPTVAISPTVAVTPTMTHPTPVVTKKAGLTPLPTATHIATVVVTQPTTASNEGTQQNTGNAASSRQGSLLSNSLLLPLTVGTLLTLCLGAVGFVGVRRARTALLPATGVKKQHSHAFAHSWQRVRTPTPVAPSHEQETIPFSSIPELQQQSEWRPLVVGASQSEGPKTGAHRRLGRVRLQTIEPVSQPVALLQEVPVEVMDMSFLNDPQLQDTLRHYRQKGQMQNK